MVIPSDSMITQGESRNIILELSFSHPFEGIGMDLVKPRVFEVLFNGGRHDLLATLLETQVMGHKAWQADYAIKRPGVHIFYMEPEPYWESVEDLFIIHYTKSVVAAFGVDQGWDEEVGLRTEIVPLSKPFGLYVGNIFQGVVKVDGRPVPNAEVEVEYYNERGRAIAPADTMITQTVKADQNGVFTYGVPRAGWWGFAALSTAEERLEYEGKPKSVEIGAVLWVQFHDWFER
jgi:cobalt/nickel transport protein